MGPWGAIDLVRDIILPLGPVVLDLPRARPASSRSYLGVLGPLRPDEIFFYGFFPPVLLIGPVIQYTEIHDGVQPGRHDV